MILHALVEQSE